jgi:hypothetical protein
MPRSTASNRGLAIISSSCNWPTVAKTGRAWCELTAGRVVCAATQIEQDAGSVWPGWLWTVSTAAVHNIRDRQSHADHRIARHMFSRICIRLFKLITVIKHKAIPITLL